MQVKGLVHHYAQKCVLYITNIVISVAIAGTLPGYQVCQFPMKPKKKSPLHNKREFSHAITRPVARGVRPNPPCSQAKFIFNETAAVQCTIVQPCSAIVTDGIQAIMQLLQGIVTYTSPVEAFVTGIKNFDR